MTATEHVNIRFRILFVGCHKLEGYEIIYNQGNINKNDGTVLYFKNYLDHCTKIIEVGEHKVIQMLVTCNNNKKILITALYRPPSTNVEHFVSHLKEYLEQTKSCHADCHILVGDININILENNDNANDYLNTLSEYNFNSLINKPTRLNNCLDHVFVKFKSKDPINDCKAAVLDTNITYHKATVVTVPLNIINNLPNRKKEILNYNNLKLDIKDFDWTEYYNLKDINDLTEYLIKILTSYINKHTDTIKIKRYNFKRKKWITAGLVNSINKKNKLYKQHINMPGNKEIKETYIRYRKHLNIVIKAAKKDYFRQEIIKNNKCSKNLWKIVNNCNNEQNNTKKFKEIVTENSQSLTNIDEIAEEFNDYFSTVGEKYAQKIIKPLSQPPKRCTTLNSFFLADVNENDIKIIINSLKSNKAPGMDNIKSEVLKELGHILTRPITHLVNSNFAVGKWPAQLKQTVVVPIHKKGDPKLTKNYRPISIISSLCKILEKALKNQLVKYLEKFKLISNKQYGFREGFSTENAISYLSNKIYNLVDNNIPTACVFLDLAKAFDTVSHTQLLDTLIDTGIRGKAYNLMDSYLKDRQQVVRIEGTQSSTRNINFGIPQGTVLGPILFIIYIYK
ncbi:probable RNA-directed DNA polymerase from transposon BS isoform X1 [Diabrotica virgifera virgifera]|uniref:Reverse transcriptase domain-containing protein n=1 Tax=Diabrotica virgifera virgifera TaxID=50390 RepID=A0ABM5KFH6_DIAVI|nr:probable RNA-directed DNA polymerase from transposon BS isoform X1 [Diabrotica virgifera virgifera]